MSPGSLQIFNKRKENRIDASAETSEQYIMVSIGLAAEPVVTTPGTARKLTFTASITVDCEP